jgi:hypothetical protein
MSIDWSNELPPHGSPVIYRDWLDTQLKRCKDSNFAREFSEACPLVGVQASAYSHRLLEIGSATLLAGIRFKGGDTTMPFVDLLAWQGVPASDWIEVLSEEFASFSPRWIRYPWVLDSSSEHPWSGELDLVIHAGLVSHQRVGEITVACDLSWYSDFRDSYELWRRSSPLGSEVVPASEEELTDCLERGRLVVSKEGADLRGLAACLESCQRSFAGWTMIEEFVAPTFRGRGLGKQLQRGLMNQLPEGELLWGTIHGSNLPSRRTALACGRRAVEAWWFVPVHP